MRLRRALGTACLLAGAALLTAAAGDAVRATVARDAARAEWDRLVARQAVEATARAARDAGLAGPPVAGAPVARLIIPRLGLDEIVVEGVHEGALRAGPGHLPGSAMPGEAGNAVVSAHRDRHFRPLGDVAIGDTVVTETLAGAQRWVIVSRRTVPEGAPALFATREPTLTLTTCWPIRAVGPAPERLLLTARPAA